MPFEYIVSSTVTIWHDDLQCWTPLKGANRDRVFLYEDTGDEGAWCQWFYARPETWQCLGEATDDEVELSGPPALLALDKNRMLLTSADDPVGLRQMAQVAHELLDGSSPVTTRPLCFCPKRNWRFLSDDEIDSADDWTRLFGPNLHPPLNKRNFRAPIDLIVDPSERKGAERFITFPQPRHRLEVLNLFGTQGDWRIGEKVEQVDLSEMTSLSHLTELFITSANVNAEWWEALSHCDLPNLVSLIFENCKFVKNQRSLSERKGGVWAVTNFPTIKCLHIDELSDDELSDIAILPHLVELNIANSAIGDMGIQSLSESGLEFLDLKKCSISDKSLSTLGNIKSLRHLNLQDTPITDEGLAQLIDLPQLTHLNLGGTRITDNSLFSLAHIKSLEQIDGISGQAMVMLMDELPNYGHRL